mmetsp:Transcript_58050/g.136038  ORF Transcript_58050/g.136038 Transcript_58050/m.136038 type:complete len:128 (+) Transcript_58050:79-462(+)
MACPLCFIPPAVAGLWGSAALLAGAEKANEEPKSCCERSSAPSSTGTVQGALAWRDIAAVLGAAGAVPLGYLGLRRWPRRPATAVSALAASSTVFALCVLQWSSKVRCSSERTDTSKDFSGAVGSAE